MEYTDSGCDAKAFRDTAVLKDTAILRDTAVEVNLTVLKNNMRLIKEMAGGDVSVMAVVKANAYGHGAVGIAPALMEAGADYLAVATLTEALELRQSYPDYPLFILGHTPDRLLMHAVENDITQTVFSFAQAGILNRLAEEKGKKAKVHIKVDTGFHRLGKAPGEDYAEEILKISALENVYTEGIFSHLALAGDEENKRQFEEFMSFVNTLEARGCRFKYKHIADSIALVDYPEYRLNMVRPGALIYGMRGFHKGYLGVEQAMTFYTRISQLHGIPKGEGVSYDFLWKAERDSVIATLPFGYADGYPRNMRGKGYVTIDGIRCPVIGVLCMDQLMADVTDVPGVREGMKVVIYGDGSDNSMTVAEASLLAETNKNDILARISARPPRVYVY
ncbi:MAG: alanine racemase [Anaerovoracaceae bacterium]